MAPDYDNLTLLQKVEVFEYAADNTTGQDLYKVLWIKSRNSEVCFFKEKKKKKKKKKNKQEKI